MRLALVTDAWRPQVNGVVTTLERVIAHADGAGFETLVIHPGLFRTVRLPRYREIRLSILPGPHVGGLLDDFRPQAVHVATEGPLGWAARRHCLRRSWPFTTSFHTRFAEYGWRYFMIPPRASYAILRRFHARAARTLVPTPSMARELAERGFGNLVVWTRGVDTALFQPIAPEQKNFYQAARPIFVYCGRVAREKNIEAFLKADLPGTKVVIGDGPESSALKKRHPATIFVGFRRGPDLAHHLASADVFVFPSRTDTFGVVMLEAMACGLPVAAFPVTGPIDVVREGVTGCLNEDLAEAARQALALDPSNCRAQAAEYSWDRCGQMLLEQLEPIPAI